MKGAFLVKRNSSIVTGILFFICTGAGFASVAFIGNISDASTLIQACKPGGGLVIGALLILLMAFTGTGIAISIYPVIKDKCPGLAAGSLVFRTIEGATISISSILFVSSFSLYQTNLLSEDVGNIILTFRSFFTSYSGAIAFGVGSILYNVAFFKSKLLPQWLSAWGFIGAAMHIIAIVFVAFGHEPFALDLLILNFPIIVQELVMAIWLIVKGYNNTARTIS